MIGIRLNDLENRHSVLLYELKYGTSSSFYLKQGEHILPERLSLKNYSGISSNIHTRIISVNKFQGIYGHGEIDRRFRIYDLLIFESDNNCSTNFTIHHFRGLAFPEYQESAFSYVSNYIKSKSQLS